MISAYDPHRPADRSLLGQRLDNLRLALGAHRLALARRLSSVADHRGAGPFEVLAHVGEAASDEPEVGIPVEVVHRLMGEARPLDLRPESAGDLRRVLTRWKAVRMLAWALPRDRRPSVFAVAIYRSERDPGAVRIETARTGLEALARALAPPDWLPLARSRAPLDSREWERCPLLRGNSEVATELRREVAALRLSSGPVLVEGPPGSGREALAAAVGGAHAPPEQLEARAILEAGPGREGPLLLRGVESLSVTEQTALRDRLDADPPNDSTRWIFLASHDLRRCAQAGSFRSDLYWKLAAHRLEVPPLSRRRDDLGEITAELWHEETGRRVELAAGALAALREAHWPGHYRQLQAEVRRLAARHPRARELQRRWLSAELRGGEDLGRPGREESLGEAVDRFERALLQRALQVAEGNKSVAARHLRVSRQGLYRKLRQHGLLPTDARAGRALERTGRRRG